MRKFNDNAPPVGISKKLTFIKNSYMYKVDKINEYSDYKSRHAGSMSRVCAIFT